MTYNKFTMNKTIVFYNSHQNGDLIHCSQGVRWIIDHLDDSFKFFFVHNKNPEAFFFHEKIKVLKPQTNFHAFPMQPIKEYCGNQDPALKDAFWINTWVGSLDGARDFILADNSYVILLPDANGLFSQKSEQIQDTLLFQKRIYTQRINELNEYFAENFSTRKIPLPSEEDLICKWNPNPKNKSSIDDLINKNSKYDISVMICNGDTVSSQRENFIYEDIIKQYVIDNQNVCFYFTSKISEINSSNVFYMDDYFTIPNLNEIEYLMKFCDIIVTSQSGPGCLAFNDAVVNDESKTLIIICVDSLPAYYDGGTCEYIKTQNFSDSNIIKTIAENIEKKIKTL